MKRIKVTIVEMWTTAVCFLGLTLKSYRVKAAKARRLMYSTLSTISTSKFMYTLSPNNPLKRKRPPIRMIVMSGNV